MFKVQLFVCLPLNSDCCPFDSPLLSIYKKLSRLPFWSRPRRGGGQAEDLRGQRTLRLLISVVIVFMCSWLPLNLINILNDLGFLDSL